MGATATSARLITARDREILTWLARQRIATAEIVGERFGIAGSTAYARLRLLARHGLVDHDRIFHGEAGVYRATRRGLALAGLPGGATRIDLVSYRHDLDLARVCTAAEREFGAAQVLTERELRHREAQATAPRYATTLAGGARYPRRHYPDLAVDPGEGRRPLVFELERTRKDARRLEAIFRSYVRARHIEAVRYYACEPAVERALLQALARVKAPPGLIEVRAWPSATA